MKTCRAGIASNIVLGRPPIPRRRIATARLQAGTVAQGPPGKHTRPATPTGLPLTSDWRQQIGLPRSSTRNRSSCVPARRSTRSRRARPCRKGSWSPVLQAATSGVFPANYSQIAFAKPVVARHSRTAAPMPQARKVPFPPCGTRVTEIQTGSMRNAVKIVRRAWPDDPHRSGHGLTFVVKESRE